MKEKDYISPERPPRMKIREWGNWEKYEPDMKCRHFVIKGHNVYKCECRQSLASCGYYCPLNTNNHKMASHREKR